MQKSIQIKIKFLIIFYVLVFIVAIASCTPKAAISSAARLSKQDYEKAIHKERRAREVRKTEALAKRNNYYAYERKQSQSNANPNIVRKMTDSLLDLRLFAFRATSGVLDGEILYDYGEYGGRYNRPAYFRNDTLVLALSYPFLGTYSILEYKETARTNKNKEFEIRVQNSLRTILFYLTIFPDSRADLYGKIITENPNARQEKDGVFSGIIEPIKP